MPLPSSERLRPSACGFRTDSGLSLTSLPGPRNVDSDGAFLHRYEEFRRDRHRPGASKNTGTRSGVALGRSRLPGGRRGRGRFDSIHPALRGHSRGSAPQACNSPSWRKAISGGRPPSCRARQAKVCGIRGPCRWKDDHVRPIYSRRRVETSDEAVSGPRC